MRSEALNTSIIKLICIDRFIIQDRKWQQGGICGREVNLKEKKKKQRLVEMLLIKNKMLGCLIGYFVDVFSGNAGNSVHQRRVKMIGSGQEEGEVGNRGRVYLIHHPLQGDDSLFE